jgi:glucose-1-phosphate thymidylyltransferase
MFTRAIFDAGRAIKPSARGELEITDAIQHLVDSGMQVDSHVVHGWWKDTGQVQDMLDANRLILDDIEEQHGGTERESRVEGRVCVAEGAVVERSTVRGPAIIGRGARITDSYVGPYTAIGDDVVIESSEIEHSIVLAGSAIRHLPGRIEASLIGRGVSVTRTEALPRVFRFVVGDGSDITVL